MALSKLRGLLIPLVAVWLLGAVAAEARAQHGNSKTSPKGQWNYTIWQQEQHSQPKEWKRGITGGSYWNNGYAIETKRAQDQIKALEKTNPHNTYWQTTEPARNRYQALYKEQQAVTHYWVDRSNWVDNKPTMPPGMERPKPLPVSPWPPLKK